MSEVMNPNSFNLVEENWIPVAGAGEVSLRRIFCDGTLKALGGTPVQKIAVLKLLLAIAQTAWTPKDDEEWWDVGSEGMAKKCVDYLEAKKDCFWLYGEKPFLQIPEIEKAEKKAFGVGQPYVANGNTTVLSQFNKERILSDSEKAMLVLQCMGFGLGGGKCDNSVVLTHGYQGKSNEKGKPSTGKPGPSIGYWGYLHNFLIGENLATSIWLNLFTTEAIETLSIYPEGIGDPPWEDAPRGEDCPVSKKLKRTLMGRLVPFSRFVLLKPDGIHFSEGIAHLTHKAGAWDPSIAVDASGKELKAIWVDPNKRPWRSLSSLLSFLGGENAGGFKSSQLTMGISRIRSRNIHFGIWSGGLRASGQTAGEQKVSGDDNFVESEFHFTTSTLGDNWVSKFKTEMLALDDLAKVVYSSILHFYKDQQTDGKKIADQGSNLFWQICEKHIQPLIEVCSDLDYTMVISFRSHFSVVVYQAFNAFCSRDTARQLEAWARNRPNLGWYLKGEMMQKKKQKTEVKN